MTEPCVLHVLGLVAGGETGFDGEYVIEYDPGRDGKDPEGRQMLCHLMTTPAKAAAKHFPSSKEAFEYWLAVDPRNPTRPDGKPNRPLTAFTVSVEEA